MKKSMIGKRRRTIRNAISIRNRIQRLARRRAEVLAAARGDRSVEVRATLVAIAKERQALMLELKYRRALDRSLAVTEAGEVG